MPFPVPHLLPRLAFSHVLKTTKEGRYEFILDHSLRVLPTMGIGGVGDFIGRIVYRQEAER